MPNENRVSIILTFHLFQFDEEVVVEHLRVASWGWEARHALRERGGERGAGNDVAEEPVDEKRGLYDKANGGGSR